MAVQHLSLVLLERVCLLVGVASLVILSNPFGKLNMHETSTREKLLLVFFFGILGIIGTYSGGKVSDSVANLRAMGVVTAGLVGGPIVGAGAGLVAGLHRLLTDIGGFSAFPCALATIFEGIIAGYFFKKQTRFPDWRFAGAIAFAGESLHMLLVLFIPKPYEEALALVKIIALPMILSNTIGAALFAFVLYKVKEFREKDHSNQAELLLKIANLTVAHLREGLNISSAAKTSHIIFDHLPVAGVSITDKEKILAHVGLGDDHHKPGVYLQTEFTKKILESGIAKFGKTKAAIACQNKNCPLTSAVVVPLRKKGEIVGSLKLYGSDKQHLSLSLFEITKGLAELFSTQLELEEISVKEKMIARAEIRRLNAQIQPHFLFNALNTIASFARTKPEKARELILDLALYMRKNLDSEGGIISLDQEMEQVRAYLSIEQARFGDRIKYSEEIDEEVSNCKIPQLIIQPLVENAVRHGLKSVEENGSIKIEIKKKGKGVLFVVKDNGEGISKEVLENIFSHEKYPQHGIGLKNCHERLKNLYGNPSGLVFDTRLGMGTRISFYIPMEEENRVEPKVLSSDGV